MSVQVTLCVFLLFSSAASIICPAFDCDTLDSNVCASEISDDNFKINANGCETGYSCKGTIVLLWSEKEIYETNTTLFCEPGSSFSTLNSFYPKTYQESCLAHDPNKMFKNGGGFVKSCSSDLDCELVDGTYSECMCTFKSDNTGICLSSVELEDWLGDDYVRDCRDNGFIEDRNTALYWMTYRFAWIYSLGSLSCVNFFSEIDSLQELQDQITTGASYDSPNLSNGSTTTALLHGFLGLLALC